MMERELGLNIEDEVNIIAVYNNGRIKEVIDEMRNILDWMMRGGRRVLIVDDFNMRIGRWQVNSG